MKRGIRYFSFILINSISLVAVAAESKPTSNFLLEPGFNDITLDQVLQLDVTIKGVAQNANVAVIQKDCETSHLHFLVQKFASPLPGVALQYYGGFCVTGIADTFQFLEGKIFLLKNVAAIERESDEPVGSYDDGSVHIEIRRKIGNETYVRKFDAVMNESGQFEARLENQSEDSAERSPAHSVDQALISRP